MAQTRDDGTSGAATWEQPSPLARPDHPFCMVLSSACSVRHKHLSGDGDWLLHSSPLIPVPPRGFHAVSSQMTGDQGIVLTEVPLALHQWATPNISILGENPVVSWVDARNASRILGSC